MNPPRAYEEITLSHGSQTVRLRPSLRAATTLEAAYGLEGLFRHLDEFHLGTVRNIIETTATAERGTADALLTAVAQAPLGKVAEAFTGPLVTLCLGFIPQATQNEHAPSAPVTSAPLAWAEVYQRLYRAATGWLLWTPEATWNATPTEIAAAYEEHLDMLRLLHGSAEDTAPASAVSPDQAARNIAEGLDPEFDRDGLRALKARLEGGLS